MVILRMRKGINRSKVKKIKKVFYKSFKKYISRLYHSISYDYSDRK